MCRRGQYRTSFLVGQTGRGGIERGRKEEILNWPEWTAAAVSGVGNVALFVMALLVMFGLLAGAGALVWRVFQVIMRWRGQEKGGR